MQKKIAWFVIAVLAIYIFGIILAVHAQSFTETKPETQVVEIIEENSEILKPTVELKPMISIEEPIEKEKEFIKDIEEIVEEVAAASYEEPVILPSVTGEQAAANIWTFLKSKGYNDYVCSGILGNIMNECGGNTLKLQPYIYNPSGYYYGICQWNKKNYSKVHDASLEEQLNFLISNIEYEFNTFGYKYQQGFDYNSFINLQSSEQAALAFAKSYERCAAFSYKARQSNAVYVYNYFVGTGKN